MKTKRTIYEFHDLSVLFHIMSEKTVYASNIQNSVICVRKFQIMNFIY